ncbi:MAG: hypothetical protein H6993_12770 [Pseudomonadales bacterium]|nr:hypothetical protein [Pseudomonadales bacterium]MCP5184831.1 hypothetical protein [Pseudomonadales bacterium]
MKRSALPASLARRSLVALCAIVLVPGLLLVAPSTFAEEAQSEWERNLHAYHDALNLLKVAQSREDKSTAAQNALYALNAAISLSNVPMFVSQIALSGFVGDGSNSFFDAVAQIYRASGLGEADFRRLLYIENVRAESEASSHPDDTSYSTMLDNSEWLLDDGVWNKVLVAAGQTPHPKGEYWDGSKKVQRPLNRLELQTVTAQLVGIWSPLPDESTFSLDSDPSRLDRTLKLLDTSAIKNPVVLQGLLVHLTSHWKSAKDFLLSPQAQNELLSVVQNLATAETYPKDNAPPGLNANWQDGWNKALHHWSSSGDDLIRQPVGQSPSKEPNFSDWESRVIRWSARDRPLQRFTSLATGDGGSMVQVLTPDMDNARRQALEDLLLEAYLGVEAVEGSTAQGGSVADIEARAQQRAAYVAKAALMKAFEDGKVDKRVALEMVRDLSAHLGLQPYYFPNGGGKGLAAIRGMLAELQTDGALDGLGLHERVFKDAQGPSITEPVREHSKGWSTLTSYAEYLAQEVKQKQKEASVPLSVDGVFWGFDRESLLPGKRFDEDVTPAQAWARYFYRHVQFNRSGLHEWETSGEAADMIISKFLEASGFNEQQQRDFVVALSSESGSCPKPIAGNLCSGFFAAATNRKQRLEESGPSVDVPAATSTITVSQQTSTVKIAEAIQNEAAAEIQGSVRTSVEESVQRSVEESVQQSVEDSVDDVVDDLGDDF